MNSQSTRFLVFLGIGLLFCIGIYVYVQNLSSPSVNNRDEIQDDGVPFKVVFDNFRKINFESPAELYSAFEKVNKKLEDEKNSLTNYRQDKEDLLSSVATSIFPWADTICKKFEYKWDHIDPCLKICQELKNNKTVIKSTFGEKAEKYSTSLGLFLTLEKYKKNKNSILAKTYNENIKIEYSDLQIKIESDVFVKNNSYFINETSTWKESFEIWGQLEKAIMDNNFQGNESQAILNQKFSNLKRICDLLNNDNRFEVYDYYKQQFCNKKDELADLLNSLID